MSLQCRRLGDSAVTRGIDLFELPPRSPELNGGVERNNGAWRYEFYATWDLPQHDLGQINRRIDAFADKFNDFRPRNALDNRAPAEYLHAPTADGTPADRPRISYVVNRYRQLTAARDCANLRTMMVVTVSGAGAKPRRAAFARRWMSWFAALCLVLGQLHVWQHRAGHDDDHFDLGHFDLGHFDPDHSDPDHSHSGHSGHSDARAGEACQLADTPWSDIPAAFCAPGDAAGPQRVSPAVAAVAGASPAGTPPIRAPPHA